MTRVELEEKILDAENLLRGTLVLLPKNARRLKVEIKDWLTDLDEQDFEDDEDNEDSDEQEETKPVIQIATSNPYVEKALSFLEEMMMSDMGVFKQKWPTEVRLRAAELILNYHKE